MDLKYVNIKLVLERRNNKLGELKERGINEKELLTWIKMYDKILEKYGISKDELDSFV